MISRRVLLILSFRHFIFIILFCCHTVISCRTQFVGLGPCPTRQSSSVCTHCSKIITRNTDGKRTVVSGHSDIDVHHLYPVKSSSWMRSDLAYSSGLLNTTQMVLPRLSVKINFAYHKKLNEKSSIGDIDFNWVNKRPACER